MKAVAMLYLNHFLPIKYISYQTLCVLMKCTLYGVIFELIAAEINETAIYYLTIWYRYVANYFIFYV